MYQFIVDCKVKITRCAFRRKFVNSSEFHDWNEWNLYREYKFSIKKCVLDTFSFRKNSNWHFFIENSSKCTTGKDIKKLLINLIHKKENSLMCLLIKELISFSSCPTRAYFDFAQYKLLALETKIPNFRWGFFFKQILKYLLIFEVKI